MERLIEIGNDVIDMFDPDAEPDHFRRDPGILLFRAGHLAMRR